MVQANEAQGQTQSAEFERDQGRDLIASSRVEGTPVFDPGGEQIGKIDHFMVGKRNGRVEYAVMTSGGIFGFGQELRAVPWEALDYDTDLGGYHLSIGKEQLKQAPSYEREFEPSWDEIYGQEIYRYYGYPY